MRLDYERVAAEATRALYGVSRAVQASPLDPRIRELVSVLISLRNGCAHCIAVHGEKARAAGATAREVDLLAAWREYDAFSAADRAAFALAERLTSEPALGVDEVLWQEARRHFDEERLVHLLYQVMLINAWNRLSITLRLQPPA